MSTSSESPLPDVEMRLGYLFKHAFLRLEELHAQTMASLPIDARELGVLLVLASREFASQHQAAQRLQVDRTTMVALIDVLQTKGLVSRQPDPADRRRNVVTLTDKGMEILMQATRASDEAEQMLLASLGVADRRTLRRALGLVTSHS